MTTTRVALRYSDDFRKGSDPTDRPHCTTREREVLRGMKDAGWTEGRSLRRGSAVRMRMEAREDGDWNVWRGETCRVRGHYWSKVGVATFS